MPPKIYVTSDGFKVRSGFRTTSLRWSDIVEIVGMQFSKLTYDEDFLILRTRDAAAVVGQLHRNFDLFEGSLKVECPNFPADWRVKLQLAPFGDHVPLWERPLAGAGDPAPPDQDTGRGPS